MQQRMMTRVSSAFKKPATRFLVIPLLAILLLGGVYEGLREWALYNADQLQVTVTQGQPGSSQPIYQHTFGHSLTAFAEDTINHDMASLSGIPQEGSVHTGSHASWTYRLVFLWHGLTVETASTDMDGFPEVYVISALGTTNRRLSVSGNTSYSFIQLLSERSGGSIPIPPGYI